MKKIIVWILSMSLFVFILFGCSANQTAGNISDHEWVMEGITDKRGAVLAENNDHTPSEERYQMTIDFQRDETFILSDQTNPQEWEGSYTIEKMGTSYMVELIFTVPKIEVTGVYGTRKYDDGFTIPSLILTTESEILSFLANE